MRYIFVLTTPRGVSVSSRRFLPRGVCVVGGRGGVRVC